MISKQKSVIVLIGVFIALTLFLRYLFMRGNSDYYKNYNRVQTFHENIPQIDSIIIE